MRLALVLMMTMAGGVCAADDAALRAVEACRARLDPQRDIGVERIQKHCPGLLSALDAASWRGLLPQNFRERREEISAESLRALAELVRQANQRMNTGAVPVVARLAPVLEELGERGQQGATRWERFKRWLEELRQQPDVEDEASLLEKWSRQLSTSEGVARLITYLGYALLAVLVLFVIVAELRAAGVFGARRRAAARQNPQAEWRRRLMLADVAAAPLADRPGMLLKLLGEALTRAHRLPASDGLTAGAIARQARLEAITDRDELSSVAGVSEEIRYASRVPDNSALEETAERAKALLARFARLPNKEKR